MQLYYKSFRIGSKPEYNRCSRYIKIDFKLINDLNINVKLLK